MDAAQGFSAQGAGAAVILASTHFGFPLSTTHVINGGVMGAGAGKRVSAVRWGVAGNIVIAWLLTLPAAAAIGAADLRRDADLRHRRAGPGPGHPDGALADRRRLRSPLAAGGAGPGRLSELAVRSRRDQGADRDGRRLGDRRRWRHRRLLGGDLGRRPLRRPQPRRAAPGGGAAAALGGLALLATTLAAVVFGIVVMTRSRDAARRTIFPCGPCETSRS